MINLIISDSIRIIDEELNKLTSKISNTVTLNYEEVDIETILNECSYVSFLDGEKCVVVKGFKTNAASKELEPYLDNPIPDTKLVLVSNDIDKRSAIYKKIKSKYNLIEVGELKPADLTDKINKYVKEQGIRINPKAMQNLIDNNLGNLDLIINEIDKVSLVSKDISEKDIKTYTSTLIGDENFELCDYITTKNKKKTYELYQNFKMNKGEVLPFVALLANQYRLIYTCKMINKTNEVLAKDLGIHPYRVKLAKDKSYKYETKELENIIIMLSDLDYKLKTTGINPYTLFEEFLITI